MHWNIKEVEVVELNNMLEGEEAIRVIDVRQPAEIAAGTVPKAEAMPMHTIPLRMSELSKDDKLVLVCRSGARSNSACSTLRKNGFENVFNLKGGVLAWSSANLPLAK